MRLLRRAGLTAVPWKNGGGVTREIAAHPPGAGMDGFDWRLSLANVADEGPFSRFDGIDRVLTLLDGGGLALAFAGGGTARLDAGSPPFAFPGEAAVSGILPSGPVTDLNVMTRRGRFVATVGVLGPGDDLRPGLTALVCRSAAARACGLDLTRGDCILDPAGGAVEHGRVIAVRLDPV